MKLEKNKSLKRLNTFGFEQSAEFFCEPTDIEQIQEGIEYAQRRDLSIFILGAGSNIVLTQSVRGLVMKLAMSTTHYIEDEQTTKVLVDAGVNWHSLVQETTARTLYGLENLTLIPGNAGAAPIQNIGAYGRELKDTLVELSAINLKTGEQIILSNSDCLFGYRDSIFKNELAGEFAIINLTLKLSRSATTKTDYQALADELQRREINSPNARQISDAVAFIRQSKLPDPAVLGNAGSFFKNPTIEKHHLDSLLIQWPSLPHHPSSQSHYKIPAAWLVEQAGWKGHRTGDVGVHDRQALVLVNYGGGSGKELLRLAETVRVSVKRKFGVVLEQEPLSI